MNKLAISFTVLCFTIIFSLVSIPLVYAQTVDSTITVGDGPLGVEVNSSTNKIYVSNFNAGTVSVIDGSTDTVSTTITVGSQPRDVGVNSSTNKVYVSNSSPDTVSVIDGSTDTVSTTVSVGDNPRGIGVNTSTNKIYVANFNAGTVSVIDGSTDTVSTTITVGSQPHDVGVNSSTNKIYVSNSAANTVSVIDGSTDTVSTTVNVGNTPRGIGVNTVTNTIYIGNAAADTVSVIDGSTDTVSTTVSVGDNPGEHGVRVNTATNKIYVSHFNAGTVDIIDGTSNTVTNTLTVGSNPGGVGVNTSTDKIYVSNFGSDTVSVISDPRPVTETASSGGFTCPDCKPPSFTKRFLEGEFPLSINNINFTLPNYSNYINTTTINTGENTELKLLFYENKGPSNIPHVALYTDFEDEELNPEFSNTNIVWDNNQISSYDPNENMLNYTVNVEERNDKLEVTFNIIFAKPIGLHDILLRAWDSNRNGLDSKIYDAWNVTGTEYVEKEETLFLLVEPEEIEEFVENEKITDVGKNETSIIVDKWSGYHSEVASDARMLKSLGIEGDYIPHWVKRTFGEAIYKEQLEIKHLKNALEYIMETRILT